MSKVFFQGVIERKNVWCDLRRIGESPMDKRTIVEAVTDRYDTHQSAAVALETYLESVKNDVCAMIGMYRIDEAGRAWHLVDLSTGGQLIH
jgi:hypothetical protein